MTKPPGSPSIDPPETEVVNKMRVVCDGSGPGLGHPRVWLSVSHETGWVECPYCDKKFVHEDWAES
ncbi:zinc-finger domain-containing protein [Roseicyclus sp. F158]|uniref:Zinc-finger domain-containing protein n=1 Tax=Tropicimonas omnivorans TaxID=3075590 RepID=A0ABU3DDM0_9RHOB|nr:MULTISPECIES: zinc-finger domain-containing protein [Roseobacteraceae]MDT0681813.1 zinc-finger domain-containing protein [Roseicyclus sp. F158]